MQDLNHHRIDSKNNKRRIRINSCNHSRVMLIINSNENRYLSSRRLKLLSEDD